MARGLPGGPGQRAKRMEKTGVCLWICAQHLQDSDTEEQEPFKSGQVEALANSLSHSKDRLGIHCPVSRGLYT